MAHWVIHSTASLRVKPETWWDSTSMMMSSGSTVRVVWQASLAGNELEACTNCPLSEPPDTQVQSCLRTLSASSSTGLSGSRRNVSVCSRLRWLQWLALNSAWSCVCVFSILPQAFPQSPPPPTPLFSQSFSQPNLSGQVRKNQLTKKTWNKYPLSRPAGCDKTGKQEGNTNRRTSQTSPKLSSTKKLIVKHSEEK